MKYVKFVDSFKAINGKAIPFQDEDGKGTHDGTVLELVRLCIDTYPFQGQQAVSNSEWRKINKAIDALEAGPDKDGYWAIEEDHYQALKRVLDISSGVILRRSGPTFMDIFESAVDKKPEVKDAGNNS